MHTAHASCPAPASLSAARMDRLESRIVSLASQLTAASATLTALIGDFDAAEGWRRYGMRSTAHWLSWRCGMGMVAAREQVRVARALRSLPLITAAFGAGRLSYSKARALTRIATPAAEGELVELAEHATAAQIDELVRRDRRAVRAEDARARREAEHLTYHVDDDGALVGSFRVSPERALTVLHALDAEAGRVAEPLGEGDPDEPVAARRDRRSRIDGLVALCERSLDQLSAAGPDETAERFQLVIHAPLDALSRRDDATDDGPAVELHAPGAATVRIGPGTTRRLTCDCPTTVMVDGVDGSAVHVGRRTRRIHGRLRRAVNARDRGRCRAPGCTQRATQIHHVKHWADGGPTCLANLVSLCDQHHWLVHEGGFALVVRHPSGWALIGPEGVTVESTPPPPPPGSTAPLPLDPTVADDAVTGRWNGDKLDHSIVLEWLARERRREQESTSAVSGTENASAEASAVSEPRSQFQCSRESVESWYRTIDRLDAVSRDPSTNVVYVDDE